METIFVYPYNESNLIIFIIFSVVLILAIVGVIFFFPLLKLSFNMVMATFTKTLESKFEDIRRIEVFMISLTTLLIYNVLFLGIFFSVKMVSTSDLKWINTDISSCKLVSGKIEGFNYDKQEYRDVIVYVCNFSVNNVQFYDVDIDSAQRKVIEYLSKEYDFLIYYRTNNEKNIIVRIDKIGNT